MVVGKYYRQEDYFYFKVVALLAEGVWVQGFYPEEKKIALSCDPWWIPFPKEELVEISSQEFVEKLLDSVNRIKYEVVYG